MRCERSPVQTAGRGVTVKALGDAMRFGIDEIEGVAAPGLSGESGWDLPSDFECGLDDLVLAGRATRHVRDDGRVLYEMQWSRPRPLVVCAHH